MTAGIVDAWLGALTMQGMADNTLSRYGRTVRRFAAHLGGEKRLLTATDKDITAWLIPLKDKRTGEPISPQSRGMYLKDLRNFYGWLLHTDRIVKDPTLKVPLPKVPRYRPRPVSTEDLTLALARANERMRVILTLAAFAGLRAHEIAGLDYADVDHDNGVLHIRGKGQRDRVVPMHEAIAAVLDDVPCGPVVRSLVDGRPVAPKRVTEIVSEHFSKLGRPATAHQLRHWFGTQTYAECLDLRAVQELLGHTDPATTALYVAYSQKTQRRAVSALSLVG